MIVTAIIALFTSLGYALISLLPGGFFQLPNWAVSALSLLTKGLAIFPADVWVVVIANGCFWLTIHLTWAVIEWCYKKIPGIK